MLEELVKVISHIQTRIEKHQSYFSKGGHPEWRTRTGLIDPLLQALGWNVSNPIMVEIEPETRKRGWADYVLLDDTSRRICFIEAKNLSVKKISDYHHQIGGYIMSENFDVPESQQVKYYIITNGDSWHVHSVYPPKTLIDLTLSTVAAEKCALQLLSLWRPIFVTGGFSKYSPINQPDEPSPPIKGIAINELNPTGKLPATISMPYGSSVSVQTWRDLLGEVIAWLVGNDLLKVNGTLDFGRKVFRLSTDPDEMKSPSQIKKTGIFIENSGYSAKGVLEFSRRIVRSINQDPSDFKVTLRQPTHKRGT